MCPIRAEVASPSSPVLESNQLSITEGREREGKDSLALDLITLVTLAVQNPPFSGHAGLAGVAFSGLRCINILQNSNCISTEMT